MTKHTTPHRPRNKALAAVHETAAALHRLELVDASTMREFDAMCLTPVEKLTPDEIRALREREAVSQPVFAHYAQRIERRHQQWCEARKSPRRSRELRESCPQKGLTRSPDPCP